MKNLAVNIKIIGVVIGVVVSTQSITTLPWWTFVIPVAGLGIVIGLKKIDINFFGIGFLAGFMVWF